LPSAVADLTHHLGKFEQAFFTVYAFSGCDRTALNDMLLHAHMLFTKGSQLREVSNAYHLVLLRKITQLVTDGYADAPADTLVNFIEDEGGHLVGAHQHILYCQHQAGSFSA
jgi:hypothetical protein